MKEIKQNFTNHPLKSNKRFHLTQIKGKEITSSKNGQSNCWKEGTSSRFWILKCDHGNTDEGPEQDRPAQDTSLPPASRRPLPHQAGVEIAVKHYEEST